MAQCELQLQCHIVCQNSLGLSIAHSHNEGTDPEFFGVFRVFVAPETLLAESKFHQELPRVAGADRIFRQVTLPRRDSEGRAWYGPQETSWTFV